ncbi:hypothetical protein JXA56_03275 [Candidatus Micrarchaeota archaeon]|nr:hypothetical protein [Candidatus Micrarchaeota archaeon]
MGVVPLRVERIPNRHSGVFRTARKAILFPPLVSDHSDLLFLARKCFEENDFRHAESSLTRILSENNFDNEAIALLIRVYSKTSSFDKARNLFQESRLFADKSVYTAFISCSTLHNRPSHAYSLEGYNLIDEAKESGRIMPEAFSSLISYYGRIGSLFLAEHVFDKADGCRNAEVYSAFIYACCNCNEPWKAEKALDRAQNEGTLDHQMFKTLVRHYSDFKRTWDARRIFDWAIARDRVDSDLCGLMIRGYLYHGDGNRTQGAREIFDIALQHGIVTPHLCFLMETGYADSQMHEKAEEIFHISEHLQIADAELALRVMQGYACSGKKQQALDFYFISRDILAGNKEAQWYLSLAKKL